MNSLTQKQCTKCGEYKHVSSFYKNSMSADGLYPSCKSCKDAIKQNWATNNSDKLKETRHNSHKKWYSKNRDKKLEQNRQWDKANPEKKREYIRKSRLKNIEKIKLKVKEYVSLNKTKIAAAFRKWCAENPDKAREKSRNRRNNLRGSVGKISEKEWFSLKEKYNFTCLCCRKREPEIRLTIDHIVPVSVGGSNTIDNAQPLCISCNSRKRDKTIDYR